MARAPGSKAAPAKAAAAKAAAPDQSPPGDPRAVNARIAELYDALPYDPQLNAVATPQRLMGLAALYGCTARIGDLLDLGCGTGVELARMAALTGGRAVGVDLSSAAVALAQERCGPFGERAQVRRADFMDLDAQALGQFDLILHYGVIFVTPPPVRAQILKLIAQALKPGGVAVLTYYAGSVPALRASLHRTLRAAHDPTQSMAAEIARARARLTTIAETATRAPVGRELLTQALDQTAKQGDVVFFHEVLNHEFEALQTAELEAAMAPEGVSFLTYLSAPLVGLSAASRDRALGADALDFQHGSYRCALFGKPAKAAGPNVRDPRIRWHTSLRRTGPADYAGPGRYVLEGRGLDVTAGSDYAQALIDGLIETPANWDAGVATAHARLGRTAEPVAPEALAMLERDLLALFQLGAATPLAEVGLP